MNGLTAKSLGIQANEGLCLTACVRVEVGWGRESGCGIGVMDVTDAKCKTQPKEKQSFQLNLNLGLDRFYLVPFKQLVRFELLFSILSSFSESEPRSK